MHLDKRTGTAISCAALGVLAILWGARWVQGKPKASAAMDKKPIKLMTLDPGHFHAALVHRESYPEVSDRVDVYAPVGMDLVNHVKRVVQFNTRPDNPTTWQLEVHAGADFLDRMKKERPGNVVVISGRNRGKIDYIHDSVAAGFNVLVDKPWIIRSEDLSKLKETLDMAEKTGRVAYDMMTERFEVTTIMQKELVNDPEVFGKVVPGTPQDPAVYMESVHYLMKVVAGAPNIRPAWFFDSSLQGEGLNDVGTHLVDLVPWVLFPEQPMDPAKDIQMLSGQRWPTAITRANFQRVTGDKDFPDTIAKDVKGDTLPYFCNSLVTYAVRGVHTRLNIIWDWEAAPGAGDTHFAYYKGSRARVEIRQGKTEKYRPEVFVVPADTRDRAGIFAAVRKKLGGLQARYPGVDLEERGAEAHIAIPDALRKGHEEHFAQVAHKFFQFLKAPKSVPAWEKANMVAKYYVTTRGIDLGHQSAVKVADRIAPR